MDAIQQIPQMIKGLLRGSFISFSEYGAVFVSTQCGIPSKTLEDAPSGAVSPGGKTVFWRVFPEGFSRNEDRRDEEPEGDCRDADLAVLELLVGEIDRLAALVRPLIEENR